MTGHELPASALPLSPPWACSAATRYAVIQSVIVRSDCDFFNMFLCAPLSRWTLADPYQICRSAGLQEKSLVIKSCSTNLLNIYFSWVGLHTMGLGRRMDRKIRDINRGATSISVYWDCKYWYAACLISLLFFLQLPPDSWSLHSGVGVQAVWAAIMRSPRCINNSSRRRLSHLITLNQTNVDERWRERGGGKVWRDRGGMSWLLMSWCNMYARTKEK